MADLAPPEDAAGRYAELERAYIDQSWLTVLRNGEILLDDLRQEEAAQALANRVRVLMGHASLYGLGEPELAEPHYMAVLQSTAEGELLNIAGDGLERCRISRPADSDGADPGGRPEAGAKAGTGVARASTGGDGPLGSAEIGRAHL